MAPSLAPSADHLLLVLDLLVIVLGVVITARAYQGSRRNECRPMLLLAVGMLFITVVPSLVDALFLPVVARFFYTSTPVVEYMLVASRVSEAIGIMILLYSLHSRR